MDGTPMELFEFTEGECFGEISVSAIQCERASAMVIEDAELMVIPRKKLFALYEFDPKLFGILMMNIAREACRRLDQAGEAMLRYAVEGSG